jgi:hypothetical protein
VRDDNGKLAGRREIDGDKRETAPADSISAA